ncbi:DUF4179 domain-containing protein [Metasolibacillus meyeri]|uniref:DUF4179 domain-containing protein n=1 Tax=Metasolibacillus meyeri TaxID=1071052 RepID=A0AAW9NQ59_9BACL|nr:DUF4179 domain-containing protein [Metasolibacillus meyeri]MEC1177869.1 DUF4179 domain-containing protein [Metasolibacillus meyeri]
MDTPALNLIVEDQGIKITLKNSFYDGTMAYISYELESDRDLGDEPRLSDPEHIPGSSPDIDKSFLVGNGVIQKIEDYRYEGTLYMKWHIENYVEVMSELLEPPESGILPIENQEFIVNIATIHPDPSLNQKAIDGNWRFTFEAIAENNYQQVINLQTKNEDIDVNLQKIIYTPASINIYYNYTISDQLNKQWDWYNADIKVEDNLGNEYKQGYHAGGGYPFKAYRREKPNWYMLNRGFTILERLHPQATTLTITPFIRLSDADEHDALGRPKARYMNSTTPLEIVELDPIVVEVERPTKE